MWRPVSSVGPFDTLEIYQIDRAEWQHTPERPGYGVTAEGKPRHEHDERAQTASAVTTSTRARTGSAWLFGVPVASPLLRPAIEAELIGQVTEAGVVDVVANQTS